MPLKEKKHGSALQKDFEAIQTGLVLHHSPEADLRQKAARDLARIGGPKAVSSLIAALKREENPYVIDEIITSLGKIGSKKALPALVEVLREGDADQRILAAYALGDIGGKQAASVLRKARSAEENEHCQIALKQALNNLIKKAKISKTKKK